MGSERNIFTLPIYTFFKLLTHLEVILEYKILERKKESEKEGGREEMEITHIDK